MNYRVYIIFAGLALLLATAWYLVEPHAVTFIDDGPYYSAVYAEPVAELVIYSQIELRRFGRPVFTLESRASPTGDENVLILRDTAGKLRWARVPIKPDGELGILEFRGTTMTWYGGWRIRIKPQRQEGGFLYLTAFGGYRFLNHSW